MAGMEGEKRTREEDGKVEDQKAPVTKRRRNRFSDAPAPVVGNPVLVNPVVMNPAMGNPAMGNPAMGNPVVGNTVVGNPVVGNPVVRNPVVRNPVMRNPAVGNPAMGNPVMGNPVMGTGGEGGSAMVNKPGGFDIAEATRKVREQQQKLNEKLGVGKSRFSPAEGGKTVSADGGGKGTVGTGGGLGPNASMQARIMAKKMEYAAKLRAMKGSAEASALRPQPNVDFDSIPLAPVSSLKVNLNQRREERLKKVMKVEKGDLLETDPTKNKYFDPRIKPITADRPSRRTFNFVQEGTFVTKAEKMREKAELERIQEELRQKEKSSAETPQVLLLRHEETGDIPEVEWWDAPYLKNGTYDDLETPGNVNDDRITRYVHHPIPIKMPEDGDNPPIPLMLTKQERKKLRHQKRMEKEKERRSMVEMGLLPKPPPKVKLSNMMRVLATEASQDPTKTEAAVRKQIEDRQKEHEARNEARKITKEEKAAKLIEKVEKDMEAGIYCCVFRITDLSNPQHRFKVNINAEQNSLTGCAIYNEKCNIVVVEGGQKALNRYKKLMLRRIDWSTRAEGSVDDVEGGVQDTTGHATNGSNEWTINRCVLVWEGHVPRQAFKGFMATAIPTEEEARQVFRRRRVEHLWDMALAFPMEDETVGKREI